MTAGRRGPSRGDVFRVAWPLILANASTPLLGLADTAVIGHHGTVADLGAIALGALIFNFVYWGFGFLRMGTTGFVAQACGAGDDAEVRAGVARPLVAGSAIGVVLIVLQIPIESLSLALLGAGSEVEAIASEYFRVRIWGAPACLARFALMGALVGLGRARLLLVVQLVLNGLNIALDVLFAGPLAMGATGVALGTAISEWASLALALALVVRALRGHRADGEPFAVWSRILDPARVRAMFGTHADIMIRTLLLLAGFGWFTNESARFGDVVLAANHVLLQIVSFSAFFLDGFAFAAESFVGRAKGAGDVSAFDRAVRRTSEPAVLTTLLLAGSIALLGEPCVRALTDLVDVQTIAVAHLPEVVVYVLLSVAAFQLDGVFIGTLRTAAMRNAALASLVGFLVLSWWLVPEHANEGLWWAFIGYVVLRAAALAAAYPALRRSIATGGRSGERAS